jgi:CO/xanthine dehydrogenase FAD-binding subunit
LRRLIDLTGFGWQPITETLTGLEIAATCTIAELARHKGIALIQQCCRALWGSFKVQNVATVGGNMCGALPAGPMTSLATGLSGVCLVWTPDGGQRLTPAMDFVIGPGRTCLAPGELLRSITLPTSGVRTAFAQISLTPLGRSAALIIGRIDPDGSCTFTVTASTPRPVQVRFAQLPSGHELRQADIGDWYDDVHGNPLWRRAMTYRLLEQVRTELDQP